MKYTFVFLLVSNLKHSPHYSASVLEYSCSVSKNILKCNDFHRFSHFLKVCEIKITFDL